MLKSFKIYTCTNGALGLHLSRAPWDPYPWVSSIQKDSTSYVSGLRIGDCLLELNGQDVLGMKISEIAALLKNHWLNESSNYVTAVIWRNKSNNINNNDGVDDAYAAAAEDEDEENNAHNINQQSLQKFATCLQHIAQLLECPVCLEVIKPPGWQCCNGHVLCNNCRSRSEKCPVCRVPLGPRGRCLLSDKLFTLLADSFPCDGVRSNKSSPKDRRKCSTEFHNQPKMAMLQKQQQLQQHKDEGEIKAKHLKKSQQDFILTTTSLRRRRKASWNKIEEVKDQLVGQMKEENKHTTHHLSMDEDMYDINVAVSSKSNRRNSISNSRKSSQEYSDVVASTLRQPASSSSTSSSSGSSSSNVKGVAVTMTTATFFNDELVGQTSVQQQQCHCITCYKPDKVAIVNNVTTTTTTATLPTTTTTLNKYILRLPSEQQHLPAQEGQENIVQQQQNEKYQNYQCPTGKLCCLSKNVMPSATYTTITTNTCLVPDTIITNTSSSSSCCTSRTNNKLSTTKPTNAQSTQSSNAQGQQCEQQCEQQGQYEENNNIFHKTLKNEWEILAHLTEDHHLPVNQYYAEYGQRIQVKCDRQQKSLTCLSLKDSNTAKVEKFFIACIPLKTNNQSLTISTKVAIFIYHMNALASTSAISITDEVSNFETIIENPQTGIKWFGRAHCLTTPWSQIYHKQHFLMHDVLENVADDDGATVVSGGSDAFVIVIKTKL